MCLRHLPARFHLSSRIRSAYPLTFHLLNSDLRIPCRTLYSSPASTTHPVTISVNSGTPSIPTLPRIRTHKGLLPSFQGKCSGVSPKSRHFTGRGYASEQVSSAKYFVILGEVSADGPCCRLVVSGMSSQHAEWITPIFCHNCRDMRRPYSRRNPLRIIDMVEHPAHGTPDDVTKCV